MEKSTISVAMLNNYVTNYQRVNGFTQYVVAHDMDANGGYLSIAKNVNLYQRVQHMGYSWNARG